MANLLLGHDDGGHDVVVVTAQYGQGRMITDGQWVYVHRRGGPDELYNHQTDPDEKHNLVDDPAWAHVRDALHQRLTDWYTARERQETSAWERDVRGYGQIQPISRGLPDAQTYATSPAPDGNPEHE